MDYRNSRWAVYALPALLGLIIASGFYIDSREATINNLSSDQWNILPVCIKLDHPELFEGDMLADNVEDVNYYTPLFVTGVRFFTRLSDDNYIKGLNKLNFVINFLYTFFWALFFYFIGRNLPIALLMSLMVRGILWLPGYELWGAGALWTAIPRTAFLALIPLSLIFFLPSLKYKHNRIIGAFLCGLISNLHPISGLSICLTLWLTDILYQRFIRKTKWNSVLAQSCLIALLMIIGLSPYIYTYLTEVIINRANDPRLFNEMISLRIGDSFRDPILVLAKFKQIRWILFIILPSALVVFLYRKLTYDLKQIAIFSIGFLLIILATSILSVPFENLLRRTGLDIHMSFQIIRNVKYLMIPVFVFLMIGLLYLLMLLKPSLKKVAPIGFLLIFISVLFVARIPSISKLPIIGDDFIRASLPNVYSLKPEKFYQDDDLDAMFDWINKNTDRDSKFIGPAQMRSACRRSVVFDSKGAGMLIEGNPDKFVQWGSRVIELKKCKDDYCKLELYKLWGADYILINNDIKDGLPKVSFDTWHLYEL